MKVLVTGGSGRVGGYMLRDLLRHGHAVSNFGRTPPLVNDIPHFAGGLGDVAALRAALRGREAVVHLAEVSHPKRATAEALMQTNVTGTVVRFSEFSRGGHFAIHEQAPVLARDIREVFRSLRKTHHLSA